MYLAVFFNELIKCIFSIVFTLEVGGHASGRLFNWDLFHSTNLKLLSLFGTTFVCNDGAKEKEEEQEASSIM